MAGLKRAIGCCCSPPPNHTVSVALCISGCCPGFDELGSLLTGDMIGTPHVVITGPSPSTAVVCEGDAAYDSFHPSCDYYYSCSIGTTWSKTFSVTVTRPGFPDYTDTFTTPASPTATSTYTNTISSGTPDDGTHCGACDVPWPATLTANFSGGSVTMSWVSGSTWRGSGSLTYGGYRVMDGGECPGEGGTHKVVSAGSGDVAITAELTAGSCGFAVLTVRVVGYAVPHADGCSHDLSGCGGSGAYLYTNISPDDSMFSGIASTPCGDVCTVAGVVSGTSVVLSDDSAVTDGTCDPIYMEFDGLYLCNLISGANVTL